MPVPEAALSSSSTQPRAIRGALTALITPMQGNRIDDGALAALVERQIEAGIHGLVPCGTTGESATITMAEQRHIIATVVKVANGRVPIVAGAGGNSTAEAVELTRVCADLGADATLQVVPYYNKPTQAGLIAHFTAIAEASELPVVLYNVPGRTVTDMKPDTVAALAEHPRIVAIKEATGDMSRALEIRTRCPAPFSLLSGDDFTILPFMSVGGDGVISVVSNIIPAVVARLCEAVWAGDLARAQRLHVQQYRLTQALFLQSNPIPVKAAAAALGLCKPDIRLPMVAMDTGSADYRTLLAALQQAEAS